MGTSVFSRASSSYCFTNLGCVYFTRLGLLFAVGLGDFVRIITKFNMNRKEIKSTSGQVTIISNDKGLFTIRISDQEGTESITLDSAQFDELKELLK